LPDALSSPPRSRWVVSGRLHDIAIEVSADHPDLRHRIEEFLDQLAPSADDELGGRLRFRLSCLDDEADRPTRFGTKALVQFGNVSCMRDGPWSIFETKDGSFRRRMSRLGGRGVGCPGSSCVERRIPSMIS
jgi:hypothetical protein